MQLILQAAGVSYAWLALMEKIVQAGAGFRSLTEAIDTNSPGGRMMMQIVGTFAEFERAMLRERTCSGLDAARKQGRVGGRRPKLKMQQQQEILNLVNSGQKTAADAARLSTSIQLPCRVSCNVARSLNPVLRITATDPGTQRQKLKCIYRSTAPQTPCTTGN